MPLYDYECSQGHEWETIVPMAERNEQSCPECSANGKMVFKGPHSVSVFREGFYEVVPGGEPTYCRTPQDLRNVCDANGQLSTYLLNSTFKTSPGPDYDPSANHYISEEHKGHRVLGED